MSLAKQSESEITYQFERVGPDAMKVVYSDGQVHVLSNEEFHAFIHQDHVTLQGVELEMNGAKDIAWSVRTQLAQFLEDKEAGKSMAGERVWIRVLENTTVPMNDKARIRKCQFEIVGCGSGHVYQTDTLTAEIDLTDGEPSIDIAEYHMALAQLVWSGCHVTMEDMRHWFGVRHKEFPEERIERLMQKSGHLQSSANFRNDGVIPK